MVNNSTVSTKMIRHRSPQIIEYKKTKQKTLEIEFLVQDRHTKCDGDQPVNDIPTLALFII